MSAERGAAVPTLWCHWDAYRFPCLKKAVSNGLCGTHARGIARLEKILAKIKRNQAPRRVADDVHIAARPALRLLKGGRS